MPKSLTVIRVPVPGRLGAFLRSARLRATLLLERPGGASMSPDEQRVIRKLLAYYADNEDDTDLFPRRPPAGKAAKAAGKKAPAKAASAAGKKAPAKTAKAPPKTRPPKASARHRPARKGA